MIKELLHKIMSIMMAFVVLISTMSFTIDMHYCGDNLIDTAIFQKAKTCGMEMQKQSTKDCAMTKKNCCSDKQMVLDGQDELQLSFDTISFEQQQFVASFVYAYVNLFEGFDKIVSTDEVYRPPLVIRRIYKLDETYLI
jgi:hypothetical protein